MIKQLIRHIKNNKLISFINIFGLGIGLGCAVLMGMYILHEFSYDRYHKNSDRLYRVIVDDNASGSFAMGETIKESVLGIEKVGRIYNLWNTQIKKDNLFLKEDGFIFADKELFSMLDIPMIFGDQNNLYTIRTSIVISDLIQNKYFPDVNPIGKVLEVSVSGTIVSFTVTGVFKHFPSYSSLQPQLIGNIEEAFPLMSNSIDVFGRELNDNINRLKQNWELGGFQTLALTSNNININRTEELCTKLYEQNRNKKYEVKFQPYEDIYLHSNHINNDTPFNTSQLSTLKIYGGIAILILLIACINYILLSLADAKKQLKKVVCFKINGATTFNIQKRFMQQSLITAFLSIIPAFIFLSLIIPYFNQMFDKNLSIALFLKIPYIGLLLCFVIFTSLTAGVYVSFYSSKMNPLQLLNQTINNERSGLGKGLMITIQFVIFVFLFSSTLIMQKQLIFSTNVNQGFDSDNVLVFKMENKEARQKFSIIKSTIENNPHVISLACSSNTPPTESFMQLGISNGGKPINEDGLFIGPNLLGTLNIPILEGEDYTEGGSFSELIINKAAADKFGVKAGEYYGNIYIRAIVADFHAHSLHRFIKPLILFGVKNEKATEMVIRTDGNNAEVIEAMHAIWSEILPSSLMEYEYLNDRIAQFYSKEKNQTQSVMFFALMAIALAGLGLFGYVSLVLIQKTKEIGIRKVNGAKISEILTMLNKDFVKWVTIAFVIATPIAWYAVNKWLENFAYKTTLSWWIFALAGGLALCIALLTVSFQSWKAATRNPVEALRYE